MRLAALFYSLIFVAGELAAGEQSANPAKPWKCGSVFQKPGFSEIDDFLSAVDERRAPWGKLVMPDKYHDVDQKAIDANASKPLQTEVLRQTGRSALVFVQNKPFRTAPFCAVVFLLEKKGRRWRVSDFVRRSKGYESYSVVLDPEVLPLAPRRNLHFYFQKDLGGRKWSVDSDEFFMVQGGRLLRTLFLENVGAYMSPADPYGEFSQNAEVMVDEGRPRISISRSWVSDAGEQRQEFSVLFRWSAKTQRFYSAKSRTLRVKEPEPWTAKGLPKPPSE